MCNYVHSSEASTPYGGSQISKQIALDVISVSEGIAVVDEDGEK